MTRSYFFSVIPADGNPEVEAARLKSRTSHGRYPLNSENPGAHHLAELQMMRPISARPSLTIASIRVEQAFAQDSLP